MIQFTVIHHWLRWMAWYRLGDKSLPGDSELTYFSDLVVLYDIVNIGCADGNNIKSLPESMLISSSVPLIVHLDWSLSILFSQERYLIITVVIKRYSEIVLLNDIFQGSIR